MKIPMMCAILIAASPAAAEDRYFPNNYLASEIAASCQAHLGQQAIPENSVLGETCVKATADYLIGRGADLSDDSAFMKQRDCAAAIVAAHSNDASPIKAVLDAEFDKTCGDPNKLS